MQEPPRIRSSAAVEGGGARGHGIRLEAGTRICEPFDRRIVLSRQHLDDRKIEDTKLANPGILESGIESQGDPSLAECLVCLAELRQDDRQLAAPVRLVGMFTNVGFEQRSRAFELGARTPLIALEMQRPTPRRGPAFESELRVFQWAHRVRDLERRSELAAGNRAPETRHSGRSGGDRGPELLQGLPRRDDVT